MEFARAVRVGAAEGRDGPARGKAARSELIDSVNVDRLLMVLC